MLSKYTHLVKLHQIWHNALNELTTMKFGLNIQSTYHKWQSPDQINLLISSIRTNIVVRFIYFCINQNLIPANIRHKKIADMSKYRKFYLSGIKIAQQLLSFKLRRLGFPNGIVDDSDSKPSEFDRQLRYKYNSSDNFELTIAITI